MRILHTLPALDGGGIDRLLFDYCSRMADAIHFDFIVHNTNEGILEPLLKELGCQIYHVPPLHTNIKEYFSGIKKVIKNGRYDIIHVSQGNRGLFYLIFAKKYGIKTRISHSHMAFIPETLKTKIIRKLTTALVKIFATNLFACGRDAAIWMWGKRRYDMDKVFIMTNAIDTERFAYSDEKRDVLRKKFCLDGKFVIGNVARLSYQKNHEFLIKIFSEIKKLNPNSVLMLVGRGELEDEVRKQVNDFGLSDSVIFMGVRNDVPDLLNVMDVFVLPSRYEGLPVTLVEVQANGLVAIVSDTITDEIKISENIFYLSLKLSEYEWARVINGLDTVRTSNHLSNSEYDIDSAVGKLKEFYQSCR